MFLSVSICAAGRPGVGQGTWLNRGGKAQVACRGRNLPGSDWTFPQLRCPSMSLPLLFRYFLEPFFFNPLQDAFCRLFHNSFLPNVANEEAGVPA